jgi:hypothetical protein
MTSICVREASLKDKLRVTVVCSFWSLVSGFLNPMILNKLAGILRAIASDEQASPVAANGAVP